MFNLLIKHFEVYALIKTKLQHSPPWGNLGDLTAFCARGVGNLTCKAFKLRRVRFQMIFFPSVPKSLTAINTCLDEIEEFKGRDIAIS